MKTLILFICVLLAACGRGGSEEPTSAAVATPAEPPVTYSALRVIGNSLTYHWPNPAIGWTGSWGMAASAPEKDFAHLTAAALGVPLTAFNFSAIEYILPVPFDHVPEMTKGIDAQTAVVVELGDNALDGRLADFEAGYSALLDATKGAKRLVCTTTWWRGQARDDVIRRQCVAHGGTVVEIADIFKGRLGLYADPSVDTHPGDVAMAEISRRVTAALKAAK